MSRSLHENLFYALDIRSSKSLLDQTRFYRTRYFMWNLIIKQIQLVMSHSLFKPIESNIHVNRKTLCRKTKPTTGKKTINFFKLTGIFKIQLSFNSNHVHVWYSYFAYLYRFACANIQSLLSLPTCWLFFITNFTSVWTLKSWQATIWFQIFRDLWLQDKKADRYTVFWMRLCPKVPCTVAALGCHHEPGMFMELRRILYPVHISRK